VKRRSLNELLNRDEPAWPMIQEWISEATRPVEVLPAADPDRSDALIGAQVTTRSPMGAIIYETGGLLIDHGWLRVLGSAHPRLPRSLPHWNRGRSIVAESDNPAPFLLVADDVLGGFFAINGGTLGPSPGEVYYFAPDSLRWESLGGGYTAFLQWCLSGDVAGFYGTYRWPGWEAEVSVLTGDQGLLVIPPLWTKGPPIQERYRGPVPLAELYELHTVELPRQLEGVSDGDQVVMKITEREGQE
jgi:hypothetical protein